jgi:hypothetical protein
MKLGTPMPGGEMYYLNFSEKKNIDVITILSNGSYL